MNQKVIGIVVEYNPFHHGHQRQINHIKKLFPHSVIVVVMSGHFTQRGEPTIVDKWTRTEHILNCGVDLVVELPFYYAVQSANHFAFGAISILNHLQIDYLCFGSETGMIDYLSIRQTLYEQEQLPIPSGMSYAKHMNHLGLKPNDVLGYFYLDAINQINHKIQPLIIKRNNDYHNLELNTIASASAIRHALKHQTDVSKSTSMDKLLNKGPIVYLDDYFGLFKYLILTLTKEQLRDFKLIDEGIESLFKKVMTSTSSMESFIQACISKRYTRARIQRSITQILVQNKKIDMNLDYIRVLGFNQNGQSLLNHLKHQLSIPLITSYKPNLSHMLDLELKATIAYDFVAKNDLVSKEYRYLIIKKCSS